MKTIYMASPYTHSDKTVMETRYQLALDGCSKLIGMGFCPISPIAQSHPVANKHDMGLSFDTWENIDYAMIDMCDELWILDIDGVDESSGVRKELIYALSKRKPIRTFSLNDCFSTDCDRIDE
jgi:nucleoside 2-deoxyribosyltransferase